MKERKKHFDDFLSNFINDNDNDNDTYIPKDQSNNTLRHFGIKPSKTQFLYIEDILYMYNTDYNISSLFYNQSEQSHLKTMLIYFNIRNLGYNLIRDDNKYLLYHRHKDFNRKKDVPFGTVSLVNKDEVFVGSMASKNSRSVFAVISEKQFTFLIAKELNCLVLTCQSSFKKRNNSRK